MRQSTNRGQDGVALITVLVGSLAALALAMAMVTFATGSLSSSRNDEQWNASLSATESGVDDFLYRLNRDTNYWAYACAPPACAAATTLPTGQSNPALTSAGKPIPGGNTAGSYSYKVTDPPSAANKATLTLEVRGRSGNVDRTIRTTIRRKGFLDFLYFTDYESKDTELYVKGSGLDAYTPAEAEANCRVYRWTGTRPSGCVQVSFTKFDTINGPLHTNDTIVSNSNEANRGRFLGETSSNGPTYAGRLHLSGSHAPQFAEAGDPRLGPNMKLPPSNGSLKAEAKIGITQGCLYTGPTRIWLLPSGAMRVISPMTKSTNAGATGFPNCRQSDGKLDGKGDIALPPNGVVYVQSIPASATDPNRDSTGFCSGSGSPYPGLNFPSGTTAPTGLTTGPPIRIAGDTNVYGCTAGDVFVQGTLKGQLTIGAENNVIVTNDVVYEGSSSPYTSIPAANKNVLGLIGNNAVEVYHPVSNAGVRLTTELVDVKIHAAILAIRHSFRVQKWTRGGTGLGTLTILGAFGQVFRGPVSTFNTSSGAIVSGYAKNYIYDSRLKVIAPPYFIDPVQSAWQQTAWAEVKNS